MMPINTCYERVRDTVPVTHARNMQLYFKHCKLFDACLKGDEFQINASRCHVWLKFNKIQNIPQLAKVYVYYFADN